MEFRKQVFRTKKPIIRRIRHFILIPAALRAGLKISLRGNAESLLYAKFEYGFLRMKTANTEAFTHLGFPIRRIDAGKTKKRKNLFPGLEFYRKHDIFIR